MWASVAALRLRHGLSSSPHRTLTFQLRHHLRPPAQLSRRMTQQSSSFRGSQHPQPKLGVAVTMLRRSVDGELECLLIKRGKEPMRGHWALPGGGVEPGESIAQAALREVEEECSVSVSIAEPFYVTEVRSSASSAPAAAESAPVLQYVLVHMLAAPLSAAQLQQIRPASDAMETRWLSITSVKEMEAKATYSRADNASAVVVADDDELVVPDITKVLRRAVLLHQHLFAGNENQWPACD